MSFKNYLVILKQKNKQKIIDYATTKQNTLDLGITSTPQFVNDLLSVNDSVRNNGLTQHVEKYKCLEHDPLSGMNDQSVSLQTFKTSDVKNQRL